ncbi:hypothetical protein SAMN05443287_10754 [Micromonospora phaseoli]|uniref:Uncharacterized protein n=1 Tax=Micromonospora phaseoli TaxID=1144548 RepID=A0A1H7BFS3_9ACTN|nr:hypothetical protein [Micromonospora phaseoli]PZV95168.1 hypothetical protein CLV64_108308 [Micromonospora phaseoli]GIJ78988.1 hypothetical protein Xph01_34200 [Micromonospora phaseoli]SEJ73412.1 hypothetical protein SAMN05443287_10754 [Micromonospora phaseoli]
MSDAVGLAPHRYAALVAPAVDRVFGAAMQAGRHGGGAELCQRYGGPPATGFLVELRTRLAATGGTVDAAGFAAVTRYRDPTACQRALNRHVAYGMLHRRPDGGLAATERGSAFLAELYQVHAEVTEELWGGHEDRVLRLAEKAGCLLVAALTLDGGTGPDGGGAFPALAPPYEPDGTPPGVLLLNRLGTLRYHRADAHAAAWGAAGHTAGSIVALPDGAQRQAIELETDRRAAGPYVALTAEERLTMLADLAALPG